MLYIRNSDFLFWNCTEKIAWMVILYIIGGIIAVIVIILIVALFMPGRYHIEKRIIIARPVDFVMDKVADLNYYQEWNPWQKMATDGDSEITGTPKTVGHKYSWEGKKIGAGSLTLRKIDKRHVHFYLDFIKPWKSSANDDWHFEEWGTGETKVTWQNSGELPYPIARLMGPMLNKQLEKQFVQGLKNLKDLCEGRSNNV
jgi:hypothetical protein